MRVSIPPPRGGRSAALRSRANNHMQQAQGGANKFQARLLIRAWKQRPPDARPSAGAREGRASIPWWLLIGAALVLAGALPADGAPFEKTSGCQRSAAAVLATGAKHATWSGRSPHCWTAGYGRRHRAAAVKPPRPAPPFAKTSGALPWRVIPVKPWPTPRAQLALAIDMRWRWR